MIIACMVVVFGVDVDVDVGVVVGKSVGMFLFLTQVLWYDADG